MAANDLKIERILLFMNRSVALGIDFPRRRVSRALRGGSTPERWRGGDAQPAPSAPNASSGRARLPLLACFAPGVAVQPLGQGALQFGDHFDPCLCVAALEDAAPCIDRRQCAATVVRHKEFAPHESCLGQGAVNRADQTFQALARARGHAMTASAVDAAASRRTRISACPGPSRSHLFKTSIWAARPRQVPSAPGQPPPCASGPTPRLHQRREGSAKPR